MIYLFIKSYLILLLSVGLFSFVSFAAGLYFIFIRARQKKSEQTRHVSDDQEEAPTLKQTMKITSQDIKAISGEDVLSTQLDLARAYIETGRKQLAKKILLHVMERGNHAQQLEAKQLLALP